MSIARKDSSTCNSRRWLLLAFLVSASIAAGCAPDDINRTYGQRKSALGGDSVNGTAVFARMFEQAGHRVTTWRRLSPKLNSYDTLVWIPDSFDAPSWKERQFLDNWVASGPNKVLIYVGRDFDAGPLYWRKMQVNASTEQAQEIPARLNEALTDHASHKSRAIGQTYARWFVLRPGAEYPVKGLRGPWAQGIDASRTEITVATRLAEPKTADIPAPGTTPATKPAAPLFSSRPRRAAKKNASPLVPEAIPVESKSLPVSEVLLETDQGDAIIRRVEEEQKNSWSNGGQVIVVTNGSFLLNMPLVNHEHRKLANLLIQECGSAGRVAFIESDESGLETFQQEPDDSLPTGLEMFMIFPLNAIVLHLIAIGILYCFGALPIFGRPRRLPADTVSDFGAHITAVGELLQYSGDRNAARKTLEEYYQVVKGVGTRKRGPSATATNSGGGVVSGVVNSSTTGNANLASGDQTATPVAHTTNTEDTQPPAPEHNSPSKEK
jgi:hypothetical protein